MRWPGSGQEWQERDRSPIPVPQSWLQCRSVPRKPALDAVPQEPEALVNRQQYSVQNFDTTWIRARNRRAEGKFAREWPLLVPSFLRRPYWGLLDRAEAERPRVSRSEPNHADGHRLWTAAGYIQIVVWASRLQPVELVHSGHRDHEPHR